MVEQNRLQNGGRIEFIDTAKAFGICFVVLGHCVLPQSLRMYIYSFHMPLFFLLSGLTFKAGNAKEFVKKKAFSLLFPYLLFCFAYFIKDVLIQFVTHDVDKMALIKEFFGIFLCIQRSEFMINGLWFLPCLFVVEILLYIIVKCTKKDSQVLLFAFALCVFQYVMDRIFNYSLVWCADAAMIAVLFAAFGYVFKDKFRFLADKASEKKPAYLLLSIVLLAAGYAAAFINFRISDNYVQFSDGFYGELGFLLISSFLSVSGIIILSQLFSSRLSYFIGRNSLFIYAFHYFLFIGNINERLVKLASSYINSTAAQIICALLFMIAALAVCLVLSLVYNKIMEKIKLIIFK